MIEIKITVPNEEIEMGRSALERRMGVLGYTFGVGGVPVVRGDGSAAETLPNEARSIESVIAAQTEVAKPEPTKRGRPKKAEAPVANITATPEHRVDPETEAQDAADEAEEAAAAEEAKILTVDDLRAAAKAYIDKFGMVAAQEDGPQIMVAALGAPPAGLDGWSMSRAVEAGQDVAAKAVAAWQAAGAADKRYGAR